MTRKYNILLIEDDAVDVELIMEYLSDVENFNFHLHTVEGLGQAQAAISDFRDGFDIVLMDLGLRESRGIETYHRFSEMKAGLPVIITTGLDDEETGLQAITEGAQDYLVKGKFTKHEAVQAIRFAVERFRLEQKIIEKEIIYRGIFEAVTDALIIHDKEGKILEVNPAAVALYNFSVDEFLSKNIEDLVHPDYKKEASCSLCQVEKGKVYSSETIDLNKEEEEIYTKKTSRPMLYGDKEEVLMVVHDITDLKRVEVELKKHRDNLEIEVQKRTKELEEKYNEMERTYKLMIGREFRIKELRDEVKKLKEMVKKY